MEIVVTASREGICAIVIGEDLCSFLVRHHGGFPSDEISII